MLLVALAMGAAALAVLTVYRVVRARPGTSNGNAQEMAELRKNLLTAEAIIKAEPQVLVFWEQGQGVRVMTHTLASIPGLPQQHAELLKFGQWLDLASAQELKRGLDALFADGRPFSSLLKTAAGGHVEADGRAAGGRAILRLRDVAGRKRDLARILDQHRQLVRDTLAGRTLLDALPMPAWLCGADGRLQWVNEAYVKAVEAGSETEVRERQIELLEMRQREAVGAALAKGIPYRERVHLISGGARKAHDVVVIPLEGASVGAAIDVAALETAQGELVRHVAAYERTLDRVATGVAIFGPDQRLTFFNEAYRALWQLDADWLATKPSDGELLDRLRELSRLPEVVNYRDWKAKILARLQDRHGIRGLVAPARRPHHPRGLGPAPRRRAHLSLRRRHRALRAREPLQCADRRAARDPRQPQGRRRRVRHRRAPEALQLRRAADLAPAAQHAEGRAAYRQDHRARPAASTTTWPPGRASAGRSRASPTGASRWPGRCCAPTRASSTSRCRRCPTAPRSSPSST